MNSSYVSHSEEETQNFGASLARDLFSSNKIPFILLSGEVGTGKTTFTKGFICKWLQNKSESFSDVVTSPTYNIVRIYGEKSKIAHFDLYRLRSEEEFNQIGFESYFNIVPCLVEWSEKVTSISNYLPKEYIQIRFDYGVAENERKINIQSFLRP